MKHEWVRRRDGQICHKCNAREEYEECDSSRKDSQECLQKIRNTGFDFSRMTISAAFYRGWQACKRNFSLPSEAKRNGNAEKSN